MKGMASAALLLAGLTGTAWAQTGTLSEADRSFLVKESRGAAYELASAKLAVKKASRGDVKSYAEKLVKDHEMYNAALEKLGKSQGLTLPNEPDPADKAHMQDLERLSGAAFDGLYIKEALRINADDKRDGAKQKADTKSEPIKDFMAKFSDMDAEHEKLAAQLEKSKG